MKVYGMYLEFKFKKIFVSKRLLPVLTENETATLISYSYTFFLRFGIQTETSIINCFWKNRKR